MKNDSYEDQNIVIKNIARRRSIRQFSDEPVDDASLKIILNAANQAPSAHNSQSWKFIILEGAKKAELAELVNERSKAFQKPACSLLRMAARSMISAPTVIAVANTGDLIRHGTELFQVDQERGYDFFRTMEIQSSAAAVENLLLAATSLGLATVWLGVLFLIKDDVLQFLNEPLGEFMAVIPIGYARKAGAGPKKKSLNVLVKRI